MRNKILAIVLTFVMLIGMMISTSAAVNVSDTFDVPTPGGDRIWGAERMMKHELVPPYGFYNGINDGITPHPKTGNPSTFHGIKMSLDTYRNEKCVKVDLHDDKVTGYLDAGYYSHEGDSYRRSLDGTKYQWLRVRYAYNEEAGDIDCMSFWAAPDADVLGVSGNASIMTWDIANGEGEWMDTVVYIGDLIFPDGTLLNECTIRQFRIQPFEYNENPEAECYIAGFGFFENEEEAKAYDFANAPAEMGADVDTSIKGAVVTEAPTEAVTEAPTEAPTEAVTEAPTEAPTEAATEAPTEADTTEVVTSEEVDATEADATEADATEADTSEDEATEADTTEAEVTEAPTEAPTEAATEAPAEADTTALEETPAPAEDEASPVLPIAIVAAVIVIAAVVIVLLKKKKA